MSTVWKCDLCGRETEFHIEMTIGTYMEAGRVLKVDLCTDCCDKAHRWIAVIKEELQREGLKGEEVRNE